MSELWTPEDNYKKSREDVALGDVLRNYDLVSATEDGAVIVAPKDGGEPVQYQFGEGAKDPIPVGQEIGAAGMSKYSRMLYAEYNPKLRGKLGLRKYREMRSDSQVNAILQLIKAPVLAARWFMEPASNSDADRYIARFVWYNLTRWLNVSWPEIVQEALYMIDYGHYVFEPVWTERIVDGERRIVWKKFSPRHPLEIHEWVYDAEGGPDYIKFGPKLVEIPINKMLVFTKNKEAGNMEGASVLRGAYKNWYFKEQLYKIDAIQKERHGIGIPIIKLPINFKKDDLKKAQEIGESLRTNEQAHVVLPPNWEIEFARLEGQPINAMESAHQHGELMYEQIMGNFMISSQTIKGDAQTQLDIFLRGTRYIAEIIRDVFNYYAIPRLVWWNFGVEDAPVLKVRRVGDTTDWRTISFAMRNFAGMNALLPDEELETWIRDEMDLPKADPETRRPVEPGDEAEEDGPGPPQVGLPRQTKTAQTSVGSRRVGEDKRGGD